MLLQRGDGFRLFTGYLVTAPEQQYLGYGQRAPRGAMACRRLDDSCLLDHNALPVRTPFAFRTAGDAVRTLANDVLPNGLDLSGVQDVSPINQFVIVPQKTWTEHVQELATMTRASYRAHDGKLYFEEVGQQSFTISEQDANFVPEGLVLLQSDQLRNDVTIIGELEPLVYVRDYFLGDGATSGLLPFRHSVQQDRGHGLSGGLHGVGAGADVVECHRSQRQGLGQRRPTANQRWPGDRQLRGTVGAGRRPHDAARTGRVQRRVQRHLRWHLQRLGRRSQLHRRLQDFAQRRQLLHSGTDQRRSAPALH